MISLDSVNKLSKEEAYAQLEQCCASTKWVSKMEASRPFGSETELLSKAATIWYQDCDTADYMEAFKAHPKIGDVASLQKKFASTKTWAENEQAQVAQASKQTIEALAEGNTTYENKFGYIFIVSASRKSADEMLAHLKNRLNHSPENEIDVAMNEQHKITVIRLAKWIAGLNENAKLTSHLTTHILDTSLGLPAIQVPITLQSFRAQAWRPLSVGVTDHDGRVSDMLPPGRLLPPDQYKITFHVADYYSKREEKGFYPEISIQFEVADGSHYHIPLLLSPFGYTTYRGS